MLSDLDQVSLRRCDTIRQAELAWPSSSAEFGVKKGLYRWKIRDRELPALLGASEFAPAHTSTKHDRPCEENQSFSIELKRLFLKAKIGLQTQDQSKQALSSLADASSV